MAVWTRKQREALYRIYSRPQAFTREGEVGDGTTRTDLRGYRSFRRTATYDALINCVMVRWCGMWLGIEPDGYTHS